MPESVAVLGLGNMGGRAAARLVTTDATVVGFDPAPQARETASTSGVPVYDSPEDAVREASVVLLSLPEPTHVLEAARTSLRKLHPDSVVVDLSTIDPGTATTTAAELDALGVGYLDAPVLGRPDHCGHWTLVAGGPQATVDRVQPLLESSIAGRVAHVGHVGAGSTVKLLNNLMFGAINSVTAEVFNVCQRCGVDPATFAAVVGDSGAATVSGLFRELARRIPAADFSPMFGLGLLHKDNRLALDLARESGSPAFVAHCVDQINALAVGHEWSTEDTAAVYKLYQMLSPE